MEGLSALEYCRLEGFCGSFNLPFGYLSHPTIKLRVSCAVYIALSMLFYRLVERRKLYPDLVEGMA